MPPRKPYNPNTAYGRRRRREQAQETYNNLPDDEKHNWDGTKIIILAVILIIALALFAYSGDEGILKWFTR